jgi:hypothetical protein
MASAFRSPAATCNCDTGHSLLTLGRLRSPHAKDHSPQYTAPKCRSLSQLPDKAKLRFAASETCCAIQQFHLEKDRHIDGTLSFASRQIIATAHHAVEVTCQADFNIRCCLLSAHARAAAPKRSNKGRDTGSLPASHSGCHCTARVNPGASLI